MIMTTTTATSSLASASSLSHSSPSSSSSSSPRPVTPTPSDSLAGRHLIYRGLTKSSMEYMSLSHSNKQAEAAHTLKGEILISGRHHPGYIQYCITLDQEWMTRRVLLTALFDGGQEKRLVLEVDQDQKWYKVTEHRLVRSRSFFRSGINSPAKISAPICGNGRSNSDGAVSSSPRPSGLMRDMCTAEDTMSNNSQLGRVSSESLGCSMGMQDADVSFSDSGSCCSSSSCSSDDVEKVENSIPFEKINLTWTPPAKGSKRGSKRFSSFNPLRDALPSLVSSPTVGPAPTLAMATTTTTTSAAAAAAGAGVGVGAASSNFSFSTPPHPPVLATMSSSKSCVTTPLQCSAARPPTGPAASTTRTTKTSPMSPCSTNDLPMASPCLSPSPQPRQVPVTLRSPMVEFANRALSKSSSSSSLNGGNGSPAGPGTGTSGGGGFKTYEHLPALDGCIHFDLGSDMSPSTLMLPLRRATLGIDPEDMAEHLAGLMSCPSAVTSEWTAMVSFERELELRAVRTHVAYVGQGQGEQLSIVECWTDEDDDESESTLVEVDEDGLVVRYGDAWARLPTC